MSKVVFMLFAGLGLIPGLLILLPEIRSALDRSALTNAARAQGETPLLWVHQVELQIAGLSIRYYPSLWKIACVAIGLALYIIGLASMFIGNAADSTSYENTSTSALTDRST